MPEGGCEHDWHSNGAGIHYWQAAELAIVGRKLLGEKDSEERDGKKNGRGLWRLHSVTRTTGLLVYIIKIHFEFFVAQRVDLIFFLFSSGAEFRNETIVFRQFGTRI